MTRFLHLTLRNYLIAAHDVLATAFALFAAFYLRFEDGQAFYDRLPLLLRILPYFLLFSAVVCYVFSLTTTKWRFISLPDALNIVRVATVLTLALVVLDYIFVAPGASPFFLGRVTIVLYWFLEISFLSALRFIYRYFRYTRARRHARADGAAPMLLIGRAADAEVLLRGIESGAVKQLWPVGILSPSRADLGHSIRSIPVLGGIARTRKFVAACEAAFDLCQHLAAELTRRLPGDRLLLRQPRDRDDRPLVALQRGQSSDEQLVRAAKPALARARRQLELVRVDLPLSAVRRGHAR